MISEKIAGLEFEIINKNQQIEEMSSKIHNLERKLDTHTNENVLLEKLKHFEEKFENSLGNRQIKFHKFKFSVCLHAL